MKKEMLTAVVADSRGRIVELEGYGAVGMAAAELSPLTFDKTVPISYGAEFMYLPERRPILYNPEKNAFELVKENPFAPGEPVFPVAAFNSPGYVISHVSAYTEEKGARDLPLFSYGALGWSREGFRSAAIHVDRERRQDMRLMSMADVRTGVKKIRKALPKNRLREHLEKCALVYGCPAGKNFFLGRYEAPLPASITCNARCLGCISLQKEGNIPCTQERITFIPSPEEIAEVALFHIRRVRNAVVSFGQGCEGDPLLAVHAIEPAIRMIRAETGRGTINLNTNASLPYVLERLLDAGLDGIRVSINSFQEKCYNTYFRPKGYRFADVIKSIDAALSADRFVSINYLNLPGFTDTPDEMGALFRFLESHSIHFIQWRNLNFDPIRYWKAMNRVVCQGPSIGMKKLMEKIHNAFPGIRYGYFNPPKEKYRRYAGNQGR